MVEVLKQGWSKSKAFLLPLTRLKKNEQFGMDSYLFWDSYSINDYFLILTFERGPDEEAFKEYLRNEVFPILDKGVYLVESYDIGFRSIFILDLSEWAMDIESFLAGKYSLFTKQAKTLIEAFHLYKNPRGGFILPAHIFGALYPNTRIDTFDNKSAIEYVAEHYGLDLTEMQKVGEIGSIYDKKAETLIATIDDLSQIGT